MVPSIYGIITAKLGLSEEENRENAINIKNNKEITFTCENKAMSNEDFVDVFGTQKSAGKIYFLDAYPRSNKLALDVDIMNPHFWDYYTDNTGKTSPKDDMNPKLIKFYAVPRGTEFTFRLISHKINIKHFTICGKSIPALLSEMLCEIGIGAKIALGYGIFNSVKQI